MLITAFVLFFIMLLLGVPIAFAMGLGSALALVITSDVSILLVGQRLFSGVNSFSLMAIPFFMLAGEFMDKGGISKRLVRFSQSLVGHITGGLGMVDIVTSVIFAGVSGSAAADTAAVGSILIPSMKKKGYPKGLAAVIQATAGSLGPIIPPSLTMIIYCSLTGISIGELFLSGIVPGLLIGAGVLVITYLYARKKGIRGEKRATFNEFVDSAKDAALALVMPVIIIGGIVGGIFTATEAGAVAVVYAFIIGFFVYKEFKLKDVPKIIIDAAGTTSMAMLIIAGAAIFSWLVAYSKFPAHVVGFLTSLTANPYLIMILLIGFLLVVGMFIETIAATIIVAPILMPVAAQYGIDPIQFALVMVITLVYAGVTPPVGGVLFITMGIAEAKMKDTLVYLAPYLLVVFAVLLLLVFFPKVSLFIPHIFFK
jgi:C4-dicarboxylate transporter DctM subunit